MFHRRPDELAVAWERPPWWRALTFKGWCWLFLAVMATLGLVFGLVMGETFFVGPKRGPSAVSLDQAPLLFVVCMAVNLALAVVLWWLFAAWLRERRNGPRNSRR